jgi:hypothetical protein
MIIYGGNDLLIEYNLSYFDFSFFLGAHYASKSWNCYQAYAQIIIHNNLKNEHNPEFKRAFCAVSLHYPSDIIQKAIISPGFEYDIHLLLT